MSDDVIDWLETFVSIFISLYILLIIVFILLSFVRLPYNRWTYRMREYVDETVMPFLRIFRSLLPSFGPLDLSPMLAIFSLYALRAILVSILDGLRG
jgi:YggT family protein